MGDSTQKKTPSFSFDPTGLPLIEHRPLQICHISGGGMWGVKSTVMMDFMTFLTEQPFARHYDAYAAVSVGSILASSILLPAHIGTQTPLHHDFRDIRKKMIQDAQDIFPEKKVRAFFARRLSREIKLALFRYGIEKEHHLVGRYFDGLKTLSNIFHPLTAKHDSSSSTGFERLKQTSRTTLGTLFNFVSGTPDLNAYLALEHFRDAQERGEKILYKRQKKWLSKYADHTESKIHFKGNVLLEKLRESLRAPRNEETKDPTSVMLRHLVAPVIIPAIPTSGLQNGYMRFIRAPLWGQSETIRPRLRPWFIEQHSTAHAVDASSRQPTMFTTTSDQHTGYDYSDGGSFYDAQRATLDTLEFWSRNQKFFTTVYECNMGNRPSMVTSEDLNRSHLTATVAKTLNLNARASRHAHNLDIEGHPNTRGFAEFKRSTLFNPPPFPKEGSVHQSLSHFCETYLGRPLDECLATTIPNQMNTLTQASSKPEMIRLFESAGVQAIVRNLPEMIDHAKYLLLRGPLSDRLSSQEIGAALSRIDTKFPPYVVESLKADRQWETGANEQVHGSFFIQEDESRLFNLRLKTIHKKESAPAVTSPMVQKLTLVK